MYGWLFSNPSPFFSIQTSHRGWSTSQKYARNPLVSSYTFFGCQGNFFCPIYSLLLMSNKNLSFFAIQTSHRGWSTSQKCVQNPLVSSRTFFGCQPTFFCPIYCLLLMSNKNLSFLPFKHPRGGGQLPKNTYEML